MKAEAAFAARMGGQSYGSSRVAGTPPATPVPAQAPVARPTPPGLLLGELDIGGGIAIDLARLMTGRLLIQGVSGAGKSWTLQRLIEQSHGQIQQIVIDPEGEFEALASLSGGMNFMHVAGHRLNAAAFTELARRVREHRLSIILDLSDLDRAGQMVAVANFVQVLVDAPREQWHPAMVVIDEAHLFAPFGGHSTADTLVKRAAIGAVVDLMSRGRKRGLCGILATQRLARLAKAVTSEVQNFLVGGNTLDLDIRRAANQIGWDESKGFDRLPLLMPGEFVAVGRAFSSQPAQLKVGTIRADQGGKAPAVEAPPATDLATAMNLSGIDDLVAASEADRLVDDAVLQTGSRAVRAFIRAPSFVLAGRVMGALVPLAPEGATLSNLAAHLDVDADTLAGAIDLLDGHGVLTFLGAGADRVIGIERNFLNPRGSK